MKKDISLYIHIPFCVSKCSYCDFPSFVIPKYKHEIYISKLIEEIRFWRKELKYRNCKTIFIGGGTPTSLSTKNLSLVLNELKDFALHAEEYTIECNPESADTEAFELIKSSGINRLSFGLQSTNEDELRLLKRAHSYEEFLSAYKLARKIGFDNINIDLMFALPKQSLQAYAQSLQKIVELRPEHISSYSLIVEDSTLMKKWIDAKKLPEPNDDTYIDMFRYTKDKLSEYEYKQYEISNFALKDKECFHNKVYWQRGEYIGIGLSAASFYKERRFTNTDVYKDYLSYTNSDFKSYTNSEILSDKDTFNEIIFLGLRMNEGITINALKDVAPKYVDDKFYSKIDHFKNKSLVIFDGEKLSLTQKGIEISNSIFVELMI